MIFETKIDDRFPVGNFVIDGFGTPYQLDRNSNGGGIMLYVREDIRSKLLATDEKNHIHSFYVELNLSNEKWLMNCSYTPNKTMIYYHLDALSTSLDLHSTTYNVANKKILLGRSFIYLVASLNAGHHGWAAKKILRFKRSKTAYFGYKIAKIMN